MERLHIAFFGPTNSGKSTLVNAICGQEVSLVSPIPGTTTDPVRKIAELPGLGPCVSLKVPSPRSSASHKSLSLQSRYSVSKVSEHVLLTSVTTVLP